MRPLAVFDGFAVQSLSASSRMSPERIDKGLLEIQWIAAEDEATHNHDTDDQADPPAAASWLVLTDDSGVGASLAEDLRRRGHRVETVGHRDQPDLMAHLHDSGDLAGVVDCWPLDMSDGRDDENRELGVFTALRLVKALAEPGTGKSRLHLITANSQPVPGSPVKSVEQAAVWGLGRVIGHQELSEHWGGLIDIDLETGTAPDIAETAARLCEHLGDGTEDQVAIRGRTTYVPRLRPCSGLTTPFPTKLTSDAT